MQLFWYSDYRADMARFRMAAIRFDISQQALHVPVKPAT
jgi:hypothetical protein